MGSFDSHLEIASHAGSSEYEADVLVVGGGPAGTWAAVNAAAHGARVILADKGYCGTSGAAAPSGNGVWFIPPEPALREEAMASREQLGGYLADRGWMARVLDQTWSNVHQLDQWGYPFPSDEAGQRRRGSLQGPEYMRLMRKRVKQAGVRILDHSPALELLVDEQGAVAGASGVSRQKNEHWQVRAGAVVIATGGCAFLSRALGCNVLTGDGYLMAAEVGAQLSSMEFSSAYGISPEISSVTKTAFYRYATFLREDGSVIEGASGQHRSPIARTLLSGKVYAILDKADPSLHASLRLAQPNFFLPFDRLGIDPFTQRFPVTLRLEGTVRGTGGLRILDDSCATSVAGLYAAGDAATRELICGGFTGGGSHNAAWAMSSGYWAGAGAADFVRQQGGSLAHRKLRSAGGANLRPVAGGAYVADVRSQVQAVQAEVFPYQYNYFRHADTLTQSLGRLDTLWRQLRDTRAPDALSAIAAREAAAMTATARWMYRSALARTETRGMHKREDFPAIDAGQHHLITTGGLDDIWVTTRPATTPVPSTAGVEVAA
ncbi:FAD-binding protein [Uliginosibacterium sp. H3]|uniref:FAD-binding protein n=1 Tax=Uliginosibacterium silvisoli TaxID=3114758 RepID=A0ABU6K947_9RHOO|nr:FAD-binding protein [Uliginosibacterium sp. H3]